MIVANSYIVRSGDSMQGIAEAYTGSPANWVQLVYANPQKRLAWFRTPRGKTLMFAELIEGETIFLPLVWRRVPLRALAPINLPRFRSAGSVGSAGQIGKLGPGGPCDPGMITNVKPYVYVVGRGELPYQIAQKFPGGKWQDMRAANHKDVDGFIYYTPAKPDGTEAGTICTWRVLAGKKLKIPASWSDPDPGSSVWNQIEMTGDSGPPTGKPPPADRAPPDGELPGVDKIAVPAGVPAEEDKKGVPMWAWIAGGLAIGGGAVFIGSKVLKPKDARAEQARIATARLQPAPPPR